MNLLVLSLASVAVAIVPALSVPFGATPRAEEPRSAIRAAALTKLLDDRQLDAIAAPEDAQQGRFVAALYYPRTQLLVVSAIHPQPGLMAERIVERNYRDVYLDLQGRATQTGRFFVFDLRADGLKPRREDGGAYDQTYIAGTDRISYDGDWTGQNLTQSQYTERFRRDDERYARMLATLEQELIRQATTAVR